MRSPYNYNLITERSEIQGGKLSFRAGQRQSDIQSQMGLTISTTNGLNSNVNQTLNTKDLMSQNSPDFRQGQYQNHHDNNKSMASTQGLHTQEEPILIQNSKDPYNDPRI